MEVVELKAEQFAEITNLLRSFGLPTDDLDCADITLFGRYYENAIVGCIGIEQYGRYGLLRSLAIEVNHQGRGLGEELVQFLENYAVKEGLTHLYLLTETAESFFNKLNYGKIDRSETPEDLKASAEFSHLCPDTAVLMMKTL